MPRFTRTLLLLSVLSLLVVPTGEADAQTSGELTGTLVTGDAVTCAPALITPPAHFRCSGGAFVFGAAGRVVIEATRDAGSGMLTARCSATPGAGSAVPFTTRENTAAGRGRIGPGADIGVGTGTVTHLDGTSGDGPCTVRITGAFHRVATYARGRLVIDVHVDPPGTSRDFRHWYCARFYATAVPIHFDPPPPPDGLPRVLVSAEVVGRQPCRPENEERDDDLTHGRLPEDNNVLEHDAFHH